MDAMWVVTTDETMAGYSAARSAVCSAVSMGETTAGTMDACWAEQRAASTDATWVGLTAASTAGHSAARSVVCSVASMEQMRAAQMDACWVEQKVASMGVK